MEKENSKFKEALRWIPIITLLICVTIVIILVGVNLRG